MKRLAYTRMCEGRSYVVAGKGPKFESDFDRFIAV